MKAGVMIRTENTVRERYSVNSKLIRPPPLDDYFFASI